MAAPFTVELAMPVSPADAQARAATELTNAAKAIGLRLTGRSAGELQYKPRVQWPFLLMLWSTLSGEKMTVRFEPGESGGTRVTINGAVARGKHSLAADPEHWTESLHGASAT